MSGTRIDLILRHEILEEVLVPHRRAIGSIYEGLYGHAYRALNYCVHLVAADVEQTDRFAVVAAFHDLPACLTGDLPYLEPAKAMATDYLQRIGRADWKPAVEAMIDNHHKVRPYTGPHAPQVEAVRRADWVDGSGGLRRCGIERELSRRVNRAFPPGNLFRPAVALIGSYALRHPRRPLPMMRW
jgi:5'-deoxynucleotidase YfbR-like HD superfamily hydrolase